MDMPTEFNSLSKTADHAGDLSVRIEHAVFRDTQINKNFTKKTLEMASLSSVKLLK